MFGNVPQIRTPKSDALVAMALVAMALVAMALVAMLIKPEKQ